MELFHLYLTVRKLRFGCFIREDDFFSGIYPSLDEAKERGIKKITEILNELRENAPLDIFAKEEVQYIFKVTEFDPEIRFSSERSEGVCTQVDWEFEYSGNLIDRLEWCDGIGYERLPGDEKEDAGTHFRVGDLVACTVEEPNHSHVYLVASCPGKRKESSNPLSWENIYRVYFIPDHGDFSEACHEHIHENMLCPFTGLVCSDSALFMLKEIVIGNERIPSEAKKKLFSGKFSLSSKPNWTVLNKFLK